MAESTDKEWRQALADYMHGQLKEILDSGTPQEVITALMQNVQQINWRWREEIEKYIPQIRFMSFCGPVSTIKWLFKEYVDLKPETAALAKKIQEINGSELSEEEKRDATLLTLFPNLEKKK